MRVQSAQVRLSAFVHLPSVPCQPLLLALQWLQQKHSQLAILLMVRDLAHQLSCLHEAGFTHRDVKVCYNVSAIVMPASTVCHRFAWHTTHRYTHGVALVVHWSCIV